jgi:hypothetical protein
MVFRLIIFFFSEKINYRRCAVLPGNYINKYLRARKLHLRENIFVSHNAIECTDVRVK